MTRHTVGKAKTCPVPQTYLFDAASPVGLLGIAIKKLPSDLHALCPHATNRFLVTAHKKGKGQMIAYEKYMWRAAQICSRWIRLVVPIGRSEVPHASFLQNRFYYHIVYLFGNAPHGSLQQHHIMNKNVLELFVKVNKCGAWIGLLVPPSTAIAYSLYLASSVSCVSSQSSSSFEICGKHFYQLLESRILKSQVCVSL